MQQLNLVFVFPRPKGSLVRGSGDLCMLSFFTPLVTGEWEQ
jgi:hypothetical protein